VNALAEKFAKLPRSQRVLVAVLMYVLIGAVGFFGLVNPVLSDIDAAESAHAELVRTRDEVKARAMMRAEMEEELGRLTEALKVALTELPNDREIPGLLSEIDGLARRSGLEVRRFQPQPEAMSEFYAEVPVQIVMDGSFHEVAIFFDRVRKMNRIVAMQDIVLENPVISGTETNLTISGRAVTFRFLTDEEIAAAKKAKKKERKAGGGE
jgi:type IV pilus assembly protein PilO